MLYATDPLSTLDGLGLELGNALERHLGRPVDLVVLNRAPVDLIHRVLRDGILIHDRNPSARIRFEVKARNEYFDLLPYLRQYRRTTRGALLRLTSSEQQAGGPSTTGRRRSREGCAAELATVLLASKFFQSLDIEGVLVCFEGFSPLLP